MPVARVQKRREQVDYVVVRRTEKGQGREEMDAGATVDGIADRSVHDQQQVRDIAIEQRDDDHDGRKGSSPILVTMTMNVNEPKATGALADTQPVETIVVAIPPPPRQHGDGDKGGISQTTEHLLIAAGSIGATIILVMIFLAIYTMRKRGLTISQAFRQGKSQVTRRGPPPPPKKTETNWDSKHAFDSEIALPQATISRSGSLNSQRPGMALNRNDSFSLRGSPTNTREKSFYLESPPPPRRNNSQRRDNNSTVSSPTLGQQDLRRSVSTRNTQSTEDSPPPSFPEPPQEREFAPLPPPPTFKQFLNNRPSISGKAGLGGMMSRFSWTNSNAPQTPHDTSRDTNSHQVSRESYMTSRSSVPRFRTIDSWVNQQTNRLEAQKLKEQFRWTATSTVYSGDEERDHIPEVPAMPKNVEKLRESSAPMSASLPPRMPASPPLPPSGLPGKNIRHQRHDTRTTVDTAPIFKQHPGTEIRFSTRSEVPSEILDRGRAPNVLS